MQKLQKARLPVRLGSDYVFTSRVETSLDLHNFINRVFNPALKRAAIANLRFHDLKHTFASRLVMAGVDLRTVQELMGHKTMAMTLRYSHLSPGRLKERAERLCSGNYQVQADTRSSTNQICGLQGGRSQRPK